MQRIIHSKGTNRLLVFLDIFLDNEAELLLISSWLLLVNRSMIYLLLLDSN